MARPDKVAAVAEIADEFRGASASVVTEYRGLTVTQLTALRRALGSDVSYRIAKNTLVKRAARWLRDLRTSLAGCRPAVFGGTPTSLRQGRVAFPTGSATHYRAGVTRFRTATPPPAR